MAEYSDIDEWRFDLNSHPIFEKLRSYHKVKDGDNKVHPEGLMLVNDGQIYVWDNDSARLLTANLRDVLVKEQALSTLQILLCINAPVFDVEHLQMSSSGQQLLMYGKRGASVLELPRRHGKHGLFEGGKAQINCRITPVAERFFISNSAVSILKAAWYPDIEKGAHLAILTSDNVFRLYDINAPLKPTQTHRLGSHATSFALSTSHSTFDAALGEIAISFDFGSPIPPQGGGGGAGQGGGDEGSNLLYPVFVLRGNADVYMLTTSLSDVRYAHTKLEGPLHMHPPAEDNYGMDACSLCCLDSSPPVLVVATSSGLLHHCILVAGETDDRDDASSIYSSVSSMSTLATAGAAYSLYVYETVELTICPVTVDDYDADISYPIMLHPDQSCCRRYFCSHSGGVHSVMLPWLEKLEKFYDTNEEDEETLQEINQDQPCLLKHMICTMPSDTCAPAPTLGLAVVVDQLLGNSLLCLTQNRECMAAPLSPTETTTPPQLMSEGRDDVEAVSPLRQINSEPFQMSIKRLLQRSHSNPILKTSSKTQLNLDECFQLLLRATKTLREEYVQRQDSAKEEIEKRVKILKQQKGQQISDLAECQQLKAEISGKAEELAERYGDAEEKQEELLTRVGVVLHSLQSQLPILSDAEQNMRTELESLQNKLDHLKTSLQQVKAKNKYQQKYAEKQQELNPSQALSKNQEKQLQTLLKEQTDQISSLINEVQSLSVTVGP